MNEFKRPSKDVSNLVKATPELYRKRFPPQEQARKYLLWKVLCRDFFQKYVSKDSAVLDIGAGYCEFINHISCKKKIAIDVNTDTIEHAGEGVRVIIGPSEDLSAIEDASLDVVFASNFFEHLPD
ncbi:MAG: methyltransferase domain-containing protein, partial [Candidatus Eisenbacteria bacterium]